MHGEYKITVKDKTCSVIDLAKWVHLVSGHTLNDSLHIARFLVKGETWSPTMNKPDENPLLNIEYVVSEYEKSNRLRNEAYEATQTHLRKLLESAVGGNAESAIEYCRLEFEGKINLSVYA